MFSKKCVYLFLPHQDDEIAVWPIWRKILKASEIYVFYTTNGEQGFQKDTGMRMIRNMEAMHAMTHNGVKKENIFFLSETLPGTDKLLHYYANEVLEKIIHVTKPLTEPDIVLLPGNEGGHPDHDVTNLIVKLYIQKLTKNISAFEYYLYSLSNYSFRLNIALPEVITRETLKISFPRTKIIDVVRLMLNYKSQRKTFIFLGPCLILRWLKRPNIFLNKVDLQAVEFIRPKNPLILYEKRQWTTFEQIRKKLIQTNFISS